MGMMKRLKLFDKREDSTEGDMISGLPDDVLSYILSLLTMKDEVKTSLLSTRWRFLWASRVNLDFDMHTMLGRSIPCDSIQGEEDLQLVNFEFASRVSKLLELYRGPKIYSFKVSYCFNQVSSCHLDRWIEIAIAMGVELLDINLSVQPYMSYKIKGKASDYERYKFPCLLFSHGKTFSLKHLRLQFSSLVSPPDFNGFKTLVTIFLKEVHLNESCMESLFTNCLLLEVLNMRRCILPANLEVVGPCVNLKCFEVTECFSLHKILISADKLTSFRYCGKVLDFTLCSVPRLETLFIKFTSHIWINGYIHYVPTQLPKDLPRLESLFLPLTTKAFGPPLITELPATIASFVNLKQLELEVFSNFPVDLLCIASAINALPLLSKLHVMLAPLARRDGETLRHFGCPHNHLKEVVITCFSSDWNQIELVICLLKNGVALERLTLNPRWVFYGENGKLATEGYYLEWKKKEKKMFYQVLRREVRGSANLVTIL